MEDLLKIYVNQDFLFLSYFVSTLGGIPLRHMVLHVLIWDRLRLSSWTVQLRDRHSSFRFVVSQTFLQPYPEERRRISFVPVWIRVLIGIRSTREVLQTYSDSIVHPESVVRDENTGSPGSFSSYTSISPRSEIGLLIPTVFLDMNMSF